MVKSGEIRSYNTLVLGEQKKMWDDLNQGRASFQHLPHFSPSDPIRVTKIEETYNADFLRKKPHGVFRIPLTLDQASIDIDEGYLAFSQIAEANLPLVTTIAHTLSSRAHYSNGLVLDDLKTFGKLGLVQAINRYDSEKAVPFGAYAQRRIHGAIIDGVRSASAQSRDTLQVRYQVQEFEMQFVAKNERFPTLEEIKKAFALRGMDISKMENLFNDSNLSLSRVVLEEDGTSFEDLQVSNYGIEDRLHIIPDIVALRGLLNSDLLSERHRVVINGLFFFDLTPAELAKNLGVSQSRISQYKQEACARLARSLGD